MINHNNEAVLIDFGVSGLLEDKKDDPTKQTVGTFQFFAPEMFKKKNEKILGANVDIWALGVTIFYILTGKHPHHNATDLSDLQYKIQNVKIDCSVIKHL